MKHTVIFYFILFSSFNIKAQLPDVGENRMGKPLSMNSDVAQVGWAAFLGFGAGTSNSNPDVGIQDAPTAVKFIASYISNDLTAVFDLGYGVHSQTYSQASGTDTGVAYSVVELAARYQFLNHWQVGVLTNQFIGEGKDYKSKQSDPVFAGIQFLREFGFVGNIIGRFGGRVMSSMNLSGEEINMAMLDFQIGWGGGN